MFCTAGKMLSTDVGDGGRLVVLQGVCRDDESGICGPFVSWLERADAEIPLSINRRF